MSIFYPFLSLFSVFVIFRLYLCGDIKIEEDIHPWKSGKILSRVSSNFNLQYSPSMFTNNLDSWLFLCPINFFLNLGFRPGCEFPS